MKRWYGGAEGDRTPGLGIANAALSHLSYSPFSGSEDDSTGATLPARFFG